MKYYDRQNIPVFIGKLEQIVISKGDAGNGKWQPRSQLRRLGFPLQSIQSPRSLSISVISLNKIIPKERNQKL